MPMILTTMEAMARMLPWTTKFDSPPVFSGREPAFFRLAPRSLISLLSINLSLIIPVCTDDADPGLSLV